MISQQTTNSECHPEVNVWFRSPPPKALVEPVIAAFN